MIQLVVENLNIDANFTYCSKHMEQYNLALLKIIALDCKIVEVDK